MLSELLNSGEDTKNVSMWTSLQGSVLQESLLPFSKQGIIFISSLKCFLKSFFSIMAAVMQVEGFTPCIWPFEVDPYLVSPTSSFTCLQPCPSW